MGGPVDEPEIPESIPTPEEPTGEEPRGEEGAQGSRFSRFTRRILDRELSGDARFLLGSVLETSDKAKSEAVKLVAREVRSYLEALKWKDDLRDLLTGHTLEVNATFRLRPLPPEPKDPDEEPGSR